MSFNLYVVLGPPGSGKGTQSQLLAKKLSYPRIVTGDLVREFIKTDAHAKEQYDKGIPQPDEVATKLVKNEIEKYSTGPGMVLDTFPLSLEQAQALGEMVRGFEISNFKVIFLNLDKDEAVRRITGRAHVQSRSDDSPEVAAARFEEYEKRNAPIKEYYRQKGALVEIDGTPSVEDVHEEILAKLNLK